jgi:hypothetical protein
LLLGLGQFENLIWQKIRQTVIVLMTVQLFGIEYLPSSKILNMTPIMHKPFCRALIV